MLGEANAVNIPQAEVSVASVARMTKAVSLTDMTIQARTQYKPRSILKPTTFWRNTYKEPLQNVYDAIS